MAIPDPDTCFKAMQSRDARFDGWFYVAVSSTGIYCRPSCPAMMPRREHVTFYPTAAAAQAAGFRACLRCRPDASPGSPQWNLRADAAGRAMRLIADGVVDRDGVDGLAQRLAYSPRQLRRLLQTELGAGPLALARAQRAQTARLLIETTDLPFADVAFAAGFASLRQFNDTVREVYARPPRELRRRARRHVERPGGDPSPGSITLRLPYREPFDAAGLLRFFADRAVAGVEEVVDGRLLRTLRLPHGPAVARLTPRDGHIEAELRLTDLRDLAAAVGRCRSLFDLDADPRAIDAALAEDPVLAPSVRRAPGKRVPGAADGAEIAVRAVLGQQVSLASARATAAKLVDQLRRAAGAAGRLADGDLPRRRGARRGRPGPVADAGRPGDDDPDPRSRRSRRLARSQSRRRPRRDAAASAGDPGNRPVDRRVRGDARAGRQRRLPRDRPRHPARARDPAPAGEPDRRGTAVAALAPLASLRRAAPLERAALLMRTRQRERGGGAGVRPHPRPSHTRS